MSRLRAPSGGESRWSGGTRRAYVDRMNEIKIENSRRRARRIAATLFLGSGAFVWAFIGNLSEEGGTDYIVRLPEFGPIGTKLVLAAGLAMIGIALMPLTRSAGPWLPFAAAVAVTGAMFAFGLRVIGSGTNGANIGGGLVILRGIPLGIVLLVWLWLDAPNQFRDV